MRSSGRGLFSMLRLLWVDKIIIISRNDDNNDAFLLIYLLASLSFSMCPCRLLHIHIVCAERADSTVVWAIYLANINSLTQERQRRRWKTKNRQMSSFYVNLETLGDSSCMRKCEVDSVQRS